MPKSVCNCSCVPPHIVHYDLIYKEFDRWTNHNVENVIIDNMCEEVEKWLNDNFADAHLKIGLNNDFIPYVQLELGEGETLYFVNYCPHCGAKFVFIRRNTKTFKQITTKKIVESHEWEEVK
jgi:hypothetical protein